MAYKETDIFGTTGGICPFSTVLASHFTSASAHVIAFVIAQESFMALKLSNLANFMMMYFKLLGLCFYSN